MNIWLDDSVIKVMRDTKDLQTGYATSRRRSSVARRNSEGGGVSGVVSGARRLSQQGSGAGGSRIPGSISSPVKEEEESAVE